MDNDKENQDNESPIQSVDIDMGGEEPQQSSETAPEEKTPDAETADGLNEVVSEEESVEAEGQELFDAYEGDVSMDVPAASPKNKKLSVYIGSVAVILALAATGYVYLSSSSSPSVPDYAVKPAEPAVEIPAPVFQETENQAPADFPETGVLNNIDDVSQLVENSASDPSQDVQSIDFGQPPLPVPMSGDADVQNEAQPDQMVDEILNEVAAETEQAVSVPDIDETIMPSVSDNMVDSQTMAMPSPDTEEAPPVDIDFAESAETTDVTTLSAAEPVDMEENSNLPMPENVESLEEQATVIETKDAPVENGVTTPDVSASEVTEESSNVKNKNIEPETLSSEDATADEPVESTTPEATEVEGTKPVEEIEPIVEADAPELTAETIKPTDTLNVTEEEKQTEPATTVEEVPVAEKAVVQEEVPPKQVESPVKSEPVKQPVASQKQPSQWVLRSAQLGVAWVSRSDGSGDLIRIAEGQKHPQLGTIKRIAPINGRWVIEGTKGKIEQ